MHQNIFICHHLHSSILPKLNPHTCEHNYLNGSETIAHSPSTGRQNRRCVFPFSFQGEEYRKCVKSRVIAPPTDRSIEVYSESRQWCGLVEDVDMSPEEWAMCSADFIGSPNLGHGVRGQI